MCIPNYTNRELGAKKTKSKENILGINIDNEFVSSDVEVVNAFNEYFANVPKPHF